MLLRALCDNRWSVFFFFNIEMIIIMNKGPCATQQLVPPAQTQKKIFEIRRQQKIRQSGLLCYTASYGFRYKTQVWQKERHNVNKQ
jgi:hypothetical protein